MLVHHFLESSAERLPEKTALVCGEERWTYRRIEEKVHRLAAFLIHLGVQRQDRVILFMDNSPESVLSMFAVVKAGAIFIMLNPGMKSDKLRYICNDSQAKIVIAHTSKRRVIIDAVEDAECIEHVVWTGKRQFIPQMGGGIESQVLEEAFCESSSQAQPQFPRCIDQDLASIIYTSGSTGEPKGVMSAHYNVVSAVESITSYLENTKEDVILNSLPLSFDYGLYQVLMAFYFGGTVILERSFVYPYKILEKLEQERVTGFPVVPTMVALLLQMHELDKFSFGSLRYLTNTAAALPQAYITKMRQIFPDTRIYSMYGLTECKRVSYLPPEYLVTKPESVGVPIPNCEAFVVKSDGQTAKPGEVGELVIRGSNVMQGYWNAPEETARVFRTGSTRGDSWLYSGDLFRQDEDGFLYFVSRKDDLIKTKAERVSPKEIEGVLCSMEGIAEAAVIGVPDELFGQAIKAFIVKNDGCELTEKSILKYCNVNLEPFMVPKYVDFRKSLPKSPSGKIDKKQLKCI